MIIDKISNYELYEGINKRLDQAIEYIRNTDFEKLRINTYKVDGDELYFNLMEYETKKAEERFWESHNRYIDLHYILEGTEFIGYEQFERLSVKENYNEADDYWIMDGSLHSKVCLQKGDFMICFPNDVHMTAIKVNEPKKIRKIVFKVKI
ncbi:YhcH/YjgK/YiaL family protein [Neobacillus sp. PS3-12]|uniref:YhcH/YjgK/YiaL family protein n=1 Tax=Neobacillus sp. PS3-12 TaxID=3070677 RepID=UPI0027DF6D93|nr:YhcH/YjgK/YiaL family protein [Neobacillus sp. PS3-12]WML50763.1 YhcH/YjgK/YiaL family protein [Neobacillus sp. PS3-12]